MRLTALVRILPMAALASGACANEDSRTTVEAYLEADKAHHAEELSIALAKDLAPQEKAERFRAHRVSHPDVAAAAHAARAIIESGGERSIDAAEFLIEHPAHAKSSTTASDMK